jgi:hypothetical protein
MESIVENASGGKPSGDELWWTMIESGRWQNNVVGRSLDVRGGPGKNARATTHPAGHAASVLLIRYKLPSFTTCHCQARQFPFKKIKIS